MEYKSIKGMNGWGQLAILLILLGGGFIMAGIAQYAIGLQVIPPGLKIDQQIDAIAKAMLLPENVAYSRLAQVVGTFLLLGIPAVLFLFICHGKNFFWLGFNKHINSIQIILGFFLIFLANVVANPLAEFSKNLLENFPDLTALGMRLEAAYTEQVLVLSNLRSWGEFFMAIVIMAFFPALFEEIFFRGVVQNLLERWWKMPILAIWVTSLVFSFIHLSIFLFLSRALLGFVLGMMYQRSRNLWVNIIAHFLNNAVAVIQLFWISQHTQKIEVDKLDPQLPWWGVLTALVMAIGLFILFNKVSSKNRKQIAFEEQDLLEHHDELRSFTANKKN